MMVLVDLIFRDEQGYGQQDHAKPHEAQAPALILAPGAAGKLVFPRYGHKRPPGLYAALLEDAPDTDELQYAQDHLETNIGVKQYVGQQIQKTHAQNSFCFDRHKPSMLLYIINM